MVQGDYVGDRETRQTCVTCLLRPLEATAMVLPVVPDHFCRSNNDYIRIAYIMGEAPRRLAAAWLPPAPPRRRRRRRRLKTGLCLQTQFEY